MLITLKWMTGSFGIAANPDGVKAGVFVGGKQGPGFLRQPDRCDLDGGQRADEIDPERRGACARWQIDPDIFPSFMPYPRINGIFFAVGTIGRVENLDDRLLGEGRVANRAVPPMLGDLFLECVAALRVVLRQRSI